MIHYRVRGHKNPVIQAGNMVFILHVMVSAGVWRCHCTFLSGQPGSPTATAEAGFPRESESFSAAMTHWKPISRDYCWARTRASSNLCFRKNCPSTLSSGMSEVNSHSTERWQNLCGLVQWMALGWRETSANELPPPAPGDILFKVTQLIMVGFVYHGKTFQKKK